MPWIVSLSGHEMDLDELQKWTEGCDFEVQEEGGKFHLTSDRFEDLDDPQKIQHVAAEFVQRVNAFGRVLAREFETIDLDRIEKLDADGNVTHHAVFAGFTRLRVKTHSPTVFTGEASNDCDLVTLSGCLALAEQEEIVQRVVSFLSGKDLTWKDLYQAYEAVKEDVKGQIPHPNGVSGSALDRFKHTANNFRSLGTEARHGHAKEQPPPNPMDLREAKTLIFRVVRAWLANKADKGTT